MNEKMLEDLADVRFIMTNEMKEIAIRLMLIKQMLDEEDLSMKDEKVLQKEFNNLLNDFRDEFQAHNQIQVQMIRAYLSGK